MNNLFEIMLVQIAIDTLLVSIATISVFKIRRLNKELDNFTSTYLIEKNKD